MITTPTLEKKLEKVTDHPRIAWLLPSMEGASYWHPLFSEFTKLFPKTTVYTGFWTGFAPGYENSFAVKVVGKTKFISTTQSGESYSRGFIVVSPAIVVEILKFKPQLIFANGFSIWSLFALILKPITKWRVILAVEGSSPNVDYRNSPLRLFFRRKMVQFVDALITNSEAGKNYLTEILGAKPTSVFTRPYEVPTSKAMSMVLRDVQLNQEELQRPIFLFVGQLIPRKGLHLLLKACSILKQRGYSNYTLMVIGQGEDREKLQDISRDYQIEGSVKWVGWVDYSHMGDYFQFADIFILPTLEDTWGMVVLESMTFGKPILCSKWAGASELVISGQNGYLFDPHNPQEIADAMYHFISTPSLIQSMGERSRQMIAEHTPEAAARFLAEVTNHTLRGYV
ncbi:glycosyltransferase family 4 protein [Aetokthonos hydrillicola Thurmond2011]|jgi:glycosyltransferase involved in cell wall biosynthesis|uniref:Glycosyltransferase family 4 protein n=1 Tax=Aetokthonos hydrillicola Thurmond2011 TaxID=2712845 RepID=A0AAP5I4Q9_9CYAN|nr:glycosyltransferase family 4 protein [Aetokthonos hydrillicola]MBO3457597.1 glycosyltransferase family 4 protein [Aetokthonos hydrillicola CCALA 1050]MBW4587875.1 glycosyltransferase family 4 protein [Aetokthonos hydrillicola CCALA 1050]MDR9894721.1 glycosyltransferase family 4 protein [Aetokthonos hydrillicola Thurmond2011]